MAKQLNNAQQEAVRHISGPLLIVAGAGTGKTTVLVERLAFLIQSNLARAEEVLITTFTDKAASEMENRADEILPYGCFDFWIMTFHKLCEKILRERGQDIGLPTDFKLANTTEQWIMLKKNIKSLPLDYYRPIHSPDKHLHILLTHFSRLKDELISQEDYLHYAESLPLSSRATTLDPLPTIETTLEQSRISELARTYHAYNRLMLQNNALDFGDLIFYTIKLLRERPNVLEYYQRKFKHIMVDEFQDTNFAQYALVKMLSATNNNLAVIGDDNQSIYRFRGASMSNIMQFMDDFPNAKQIVLAQNYRSGQSILDGAYTLIKQNDPNTLEAKLGINKKLESKTDYAGEIKTYEFENGHEEAAFIASQIKQEKEKNSVSWNNFAILVRSNADAENFVAELTRQNIPNLFVSLRGLYYKPIIMDITAYLRLLDNYHESSALYRVMSTPPFRVGYEDIIEINLFKRRMKYHSLYEAIKNIDKNAKISAEGVANIKKLLQFIAQHSQDALERAGSWLFVKFIYDSGLLAGLDYDKDKEVFSHINQFYNKIKAFEDNNPGARIKDFMEYFNMELEAGDTGALKLDFEDSDVVKIMTAHGSKGLEFDFVFLPILVNRKFPSDNRRDPLPIPDALVKEKLPTGGNEHLEEERRLFYVAVTRARKKLYLTYAVNYGGVLAKKPSIFIAETMYDGGKAEKLAKNILNNDFIRDLESYKNGSFAYEEIAKTVLPSQFSFSQFSAFDKCPLQYKFNFILRIPTPDSPSKTFGQTMHRTVNEFLTPFILSVQQGLFGENHKPELPPFKHLLEIYDKFWIGTAYKDADENADFKKQGKQMLTNFYEDMAQSGAPKIQALEKSFSLKIGNYAVKGAIDRIDILDDGSLEIIDYKTGSPKTALDAESKRQLLLYKKAVEEMFGKPVSRLTYYYFKDGSRASFSAKDKDIVAMEVKILEIIQGISQGVFPPKPNMLCRYCDFKTICEYAAV